MTRQAQFVPMLVRRSAPEQALLPALRGENRAILDLRLRIRRIAPYLRVGTVQAPCVEGATAVARALHETCNADDPFELVTVENREAASQREWQLVERWGSGTLVIEDIADLSLGEQRGLLGALLRRSRHLVPPEHAGRVLATLTKPAQTLIASGHLLPELNQRIGTGVIRLPAVAERREDIPAIAAGMLADLSATESGYRGPARSSLDPECLPMLRAHTWPGDLSELREVLTVALRYSESPVVMASAVRQALLVAGLTEPIPESTPERLQTVIERHVLAVLNRCAGNKVRTSELLGISRSTLYRMLDSLTS